MYNYLINQIIHHHLMLYSPHQLTCFAHQLMRRAVDRRTPFVHIEMIADKSEQTCCMTLAEIAECKRMENASRFMPGAELWPIYKGS